jgi:tetratricopeptide (TPR) repeat protein
LRARLHLKLGNDAKAKADLISAATLEKDINNDVEQAKEHIKAGVGLPEALNRAQKRGDSVAAAPTNEQSVPATSAGPVSCQDVTGAYQAAVEACTRLIMSGKAGGDELITAYIWRGSHLTFLGVHDKAVDDFDRALKLDPNLALAYRGRGASYESSGDLARALADYRKAHSLDPSLDDVAASIQRLQSAAR